MNGSDFILYLRGDKFYVEAFCKKYNACLIDIVPNTEDCPPRGLIYLFDNQYGGFSIEGIKNSLNNRKPDSLDDII